MATLSAQGVVKNYLESPGCVANVLEDPKQLRWGQLCSFTPCKLRFSALASCFALPPASVQSCAHFRLARKHNLTFYETRGVSVGLKLVREPGETVHAVVSSPLKKILQAGRKGLSTKLF